MKKIKIITAALLATALFTFLIFPNQQAVSENILTANGKPMVAPTWELKNLTGQTIRSADLKGKVIVIDFWATWCGPCQEEIPGFIALQKQYGEQGLVVIGLSVDEGGGDTVRKFTQKLGVNYPILLADEKTQQLFGGIDALPTTFVIDRQGYFAKKHVGFTDKDQLDAEIKALLAKK